MKTRASLTLGFTLAVLAALSLLLVTTLLAALLIGSQSIAPYPIITALGHRLFGAPTGLTPEIELIIFSIRLPRAILAIMAGASLSVAGAALQALLRNALAEPYVLGVSSGAAVGAILAIMWAETLPIGQPLGAFLGALITVLVVYILGQGRRGTSTERLILAGVITTSFLWAAIIFLLTMASTSRLRGIAFWLMGDLSGSTSLLLKTSLIISLISMGAIYLLAQPLNLIMVGEESALSLGVRVEVIKVAVYLLASLLTGVVVAMAGSIGYIGLIVPHIIRMAWSSDHRLLLPASALLGASLLLLADTVARTIIAPRELPVGAITALMGAPLFVYLLRRSA